MRRSWGRLLDCGKTCAIGTRHPLVRPWIPPVSCRSAVRWSSTSATTEQATTGNLTVKKKPAAELTGAHVAHSIALPTLPDELNSPYPHTLQDELSSASGPEPPSETADREQRRLLARARLYGIHSASQLDHEIGIDDNAPKGSRMLDGGRPREDLDLWVFLIDAARKRHGSSGVWALYRILVNRGRPLELTANNANARDIVDAFLSAAIFEPIRPAESGPEKKRWHEWRIARMCNTFIKHQYCEELLFVGVIGGLLKTRPRAAVWMAKWFASNAPEHHHGLDDLYQVFQSVCEMPTVNNLKACNTIFNMLTSAKVYRETVAHLWVKGQADAAFAWHEHRLLCGDLPPTFETLLPFVAHLAVAGGPIEPFIAKLVAHGVDYTTQIESVYKRAVAQIADDPGAARDVVLKRIKVGSSAFSDETIARALATSTFSFEFVVNSMAFLGAIEFGPLAVRQMVLGAPDLSTLDARYKKLRDMGIDTGSHPFIVTVNRLHQSRDFEVLRRVAATDMHHDEFSDVALQRSLISEYQRSKNVEGLTQSLLVLRQGKNTVGDRRLVEMDILVDAIGRSDWQRTLEIIVSLHHKGHAVDDHVLSHLVQRCLTPHDSLTTKAIAAQSPAPADMIAFVIGVAQQALLLGSHIALQFWSRPFTALCQNSRVSEAHSLVLWLAKHYSCDDTRLAHLPKQDWTQDLLTPLRQKALVAWDFIKTPWRNALFPDPGKPYADLSVIPIDSGNAPWTAAARLLRRLHDDPAVRLQISYLDLEQEFLLRLQYMRHGNTSSRVTSNRKWSSYRGFSSEHLAEHWLQVWHGFGTEVDRDRLMRAAAEIDSGLVVPEKWKSMQDRRKWVVRRHNPSFMGPESRYDQLP